MDGSDFYDELQQGKPGDFEKARNFYSNMARVVARERKRIGGNWAVAQAVPSRKCRDVIRSVLGQEVTFVLLILSSETQSERVKGRHGDSEAGQAIADMCIKVGKLYEPKAEDEENTFDIIIEKEMSQDDVLEKVLQTIA